MFDADPTTEPGSSAIRHFLSAAHKALDVPAPRHAQDRPPYLDLLESRARIVGASLGRLIASEHSEDLDFTSEGDHILHQIADLPPDTYRHDPGH